MSQWSRIGPCIGALCLLAEFGAAADPASSTAELARCSMIGAPDARLACYDQLARSVAKRAAGTSDAGAATSPGVPPASPTNAVSAARAAVPALAGGAASGSDADDASSFGLTEGQVHVAPKGPKAITARISALNQDARGTTYAVLDNGQTWSFINEDQRLRPGDSITIKRAALGAYMVWTPSNHSFHAHRTR